MTVTTAKEFLQLIAKHYETCKGSYLLIMHNLPIELIDGRTAILKGVPEDEKERQDVAIMNATFAALVCETGEQEQIVPTDIYQEVYEIFKIMMSFEKFVALGYMEWDKTQKDEYGFPVAKIIVPPDKWDRGDGNG